jgi:predicted AAA+ superfamily ATPase
MIMAVRDAVIRQKSEYESKRKERYTDRAVAVSGPDSNLIKVITGPRRAGKSFFALPHFTGTTKAGYVNFDDERLAGQPTMMRSSLQ